jgi:murein DD-endopeptidase MepM/ murein hydrolase activator NlpD
VSSSREDNGRYRGRRRAAGSPRARYAAVATTAFVGAGMVALGIAAAMPDVKADPASLAAADNVSQHQLDTSARQAQSDRASRAEARGTTTAGDQVGSDSVSQNLWLLPVKNYRVSAPFGEHAGSMHAGVDLAAPEGTFYYASHAGVVKLARYDGGLGYTVVLDIGNKITITYGHSAKVLVHEGQRVNAGDPLGMVGCTGYAFDNALYFEIRVNSQAVNPANYLKQFGLDLVHGTDAITG